MKWLVIVVVAACGHDVGTVPDSAPQPPIDAPPVRLAVMPATIDFQTAVVDCSIAGPVAIVVTNVGGVPTGEVTATLAGADPSEFAIAPTACGPLAPAAHCELEATFAPTTIGGKTANLLISAGPGTDALVIFTGAAVSTGPLAISPSNHDFGNVVVGAISSPQVFTVMNICSATTTGSFTVTPSGADPSQFVKSADTCTGATLGPLGTCSIDVAFAPTFAGARSASFDLVAIPGGPVTASVSGNALAVPAPKLAISPATIDLGAVGPGQTSPDPSSCQPPTVSSVTVTNTGTAATAALTAAVSGSGFAIANDLCSGHSLDPGAACTIGVKFTAGSSFGTQTGSLTVTAGSLVAHADLTANVVSDAGGFIAANPGSLSFGTVTIMATSATRSFTVTNNGACPTAPLQLQMTGTNATDFSFVPTGTCTNAVLVGGQSCRVDVRFAPISSPGSHTATATVSGSPGGTVMVALDGIAGSTFPLAIAPASHDFGGQNFGSCPSSPTKFTLTNSGAVSYGPFTSSLAGTGSASFAIGQDGCSGTTLAQGASCTIDVTFAPMLPGGSKSAVLQLTSSMLSVQAALSGVTLTGAGLVTDQCSLAFGTVAPGSTAMRTFVITNDGATTSGPLQVAVSGADAALFSTATDTCTNATLANGQSCSIDIAFAPTASGNRTATATVSGSPGGVVNIALTGD